MLREFATFTEALTAGTLVLVLEDLHWSDPSTVDLLSVLAERTSRRDYWYRHVPPSRDRSARARLSQAVRTLQVHRQSVAIPVTSSAERDVASYLERVSRRRDFPAGLAPLIHEHTDGNRCSWWRSSTICCRAAGFSTPRPDGRSASP